jgi:hypothetical protein
MTFATAFPRFRVQPLDVLGHALQLLRLDLALVPAFQEPHLLDQGPHLQGPEVGGQVHLRQLLERAAWKMLEEPVVVIDGGRGPVTDKRGD